MSNSTDDNDVLVKRGRAVLDPMADLVPLHPHADADHLAAFDACRLGMIYDAATRRMLDRARGDERPLVLPWTEANAALGGGLWPGLHVLVGDPGSGKTQWALQAALHAADGRSNHNGSDVPVLYIGLELDHTAVVARLLGLVAGQRWRDLYVGKSESQLQTAMRHGNCIARIPFFVDVAPPVGWDHATLYARVEALRRLHPGGPILIVVDCLQLVAGEGRDLRERIGRASHQARAAARDFGAVMLVLSSTARESCASLRGDGLGQGSPLRLVGLGKDAGDIEHVADSVLVLMPEPHGEEQGSQPQRTVSLAVARATAGRPGWVALTFDGCRFHDPSES